jgi:hypothetical protein
MRLRTALGVSLFVSLALVAADKNQMLNVPLNVKVGLWQMTYTSDGNGVAVPQTIPRGLLAKMSPEQRARTAARLKARAALGPRTETRQYCLTQDRLKKAIFNNEEIQTCQRTIVASSAKLQTFHEECFQSGTKRTAEGRFEALDYHTLKGILKIKSQGGNPLTANIAIAGKWIGNDCGDRAQ